MQPITYLCFTILSILIQFSLLDFTNTKDEDNDDIFVENMSTTYKNINILRKINQKPHALYYRTEKNKLLDLENFVFPIKYDNASHIESPFMSSTELDSTVFDLLYDDNVSTADNHFTSDLPFATSELDNVTEITFFEASSTAKPTDIPNKTTALSDCNCDLLHTICDINCCCDHDCTESEQSMFNCKKIDGTDTCTYYNKYQKYLCNSEPTCNNIQTSHFFQNLFCIDKVNLPEKKTKYIEKFYSPNISDFYSWEKKEKHDDKHEFSKEMYAAGQFIWVLKNRDLNVIDLPIMLTNNYCSGRKALKFLKNEEIKCLVKLQDLHLLNILQSFEDTIIVSPTSTSNSTVMNCSTLHCVNWTLLVCDEAKCTPFNKSLHEPTCSERYCSNIAVKINYLFYCNASNITKAVIRLHVTRVSMARQVIKQEINVNFYMTNDSIDNVVRLSGHPGYMKGLPIIASYLKNNHTKYFYNNTAGNKNHISFPVNKNGDCLLTDTTENILVFGHNKRMKCRLPLKKNKINNGTDECLKIQDQVKKLLGFDVKAFISPYGNPLGVKDDKWLGLELLTGDIIYGEYRKQSSKLLCFNLVTSISYIITFADINGINKNNNKILSARIEVNPENIVLDMEYLSLVVTVDTNFINAMPVFEPIDLNLKFLSSNLQFPFPSNKCHSSSKGYALIIYIFTIYVMFK